MKIKVKMISLSRYDWDLEVTDEHGTLTHQGDDALNFLDDSLMRRMFNCAEKGR